MMRGSERGAASDRQHRQGRRATRRHIGRAPAIRGMHRHELEQIGNAKLQKKLMAQGEFVATNQFEFSMTNRKGLEEHDQSQGLGRGARWSMEE